MKRITILLILVTLTLSVSACGPSGTPFPVDLVQADPGNPASVVTAFFTARSAFNADAAMQYVNESTVISNPFGTFTGTAQIRQDVVQGMIDENTQFTVLNPQTNGDIVTFDLQVYVNGQETDVLSGQAVVQNGIIVGLTLE